MYNSVNISRGSIYPQNINQNSAKIMSTIMTEYGIKCKCARVNSVLKLMMLHVRYEARIEK